MRPSEKAWLICGNDSSALATRTFSRPAPKSMPHFQLSQWAQERKPVGPGLAAVELADKGEQAVGGGVDVGGELGDLGVENVAGSESGIVGEGVHSGAPLRG